MARSAATAVTPLAVEDRLRAIALAGTAAGSSSLLTPALLQQFLALATTVHKGNLVCRMAKRLCDSRCKLATEMIKFVDRCMRSYASRIGEKCFWHFTFAQLEKDTEDTWYSIQPVSLPKNAMLQFLMLAPDPQTVKVWKPLSYA